MAELDPVQIVTKVARLTPGPFTGLHSNDKWHRERRELLHDALELRLRKNGVPITGKTSAPILFVLVNILKHAELAIHIYSLEFGLVQLADPIRVPPNNESTHTITWQFSYTGYGSLETLQDVFRETVLLFADKFSLDYLRANPTDQKNPTIRYWPQNAVKP